MPEPDNNAVSRLTIGQVVDLLAGEYPDITHSSLRFLEREGLITPDRTSGGHRLFPPDQVNRIRTIKTWQRQRLSLDEIRVRLQKADQLPGIETMARGFFDLLIAGDRDAAQRLILEADDAGTSLAAIFDGVLRPVLLETGELWASGELSVGQEKEISAFTRDLIALLSARHRNAGPEDQLSLVAACVEGEYHELGLRMLTALLRERGLSVHYLGPSVAAPFLAERVTHRRPIAVLLAASQVERLPALEDAVRALRTLNIPDYDPLIFIGGAGVSPTDCLSQANHLKVVQGADLRSVTDQIASAIAG